MKITEGMIIDRYGRINHRHLKKLSTDELIDVANLSQWPLPKSLLTECQLRGVMPEVVRLHEASKAAPNR